MQFLRQSTQVIVRAGPFVDNVDGVTPELAVTLSGADQAELLKHDGVATVDIGAATFAGITGAGGWYDLTLTTGHTDTLGMLTVVVQRANLHLPVFMNFMVVNANVYDSLIRPGTDFLQVDVQQQQGAAPATVSDIATAVIPQRNQPFSDLEFVMRDNTNHNPATGLAVTGSRSINGGAFVAVTGTIAEVGNGVYQLDASAADMNGAFITFRFVAAGADAAFVHLRTAV